MKIKECINQGVFFMDGGTGSMLQQKGLAPGEFPETWNLSRPRDIVELHKAYYEAGSHAVVTNTFGANGLKFPGKGADPSVARIVAAAVACAQQARDTARGGPDQRFVALDIGPLGRLLAPAGDLPFERAVELFSEIVAAGDRAGADFIFIETLGDSYETKAAVLAAKENSGLPVFVSNAYQQNGRTQSGATPGVMAAMLQGMGVDALGMNCSLGPDQMETLLPGFTACSRLPLIVKPNAGLPHSEGGGPVYDVSPEAFARTMARMVARGAGIVGGCCGTTPDHIQALVREVRDLAPRPARPALARSQTVISSSTRTVTFGEGPILIGERINPTGRKQLQEALRKRELGYVVQEALAQQACGAQVLDVNAGLPGTDEADLLTSCVKRIQQSCDLPLQLDTSDAKAMEQALRVYNGKPMVNSVNGDPHSMDSIFPLVKKYGGLVVCLTLDEKGIPESAQGRLAVAEKIFRRAQDYGIPASDLIFDPLAMTITAEPLAASVALESVRLIQNRLGCPCLLGISNISFGLPRRDRIAGAFLTMAFSQGLDAAILNPCSPEIQAAYRSYMALAGLDEHCGAYIRHAGDTAAGRSELPAKTGAPGEGFPQDLRAAIEEGLPEEAVLAARRELAGHTPLDLINSRIVPALDQVGRDFEADVIFLPQLMLSAQAAKAAFDEIRKSLPASERQGPAVVLATVRNDIHDIGKNIAKTLLENYGYRIVDLGKDVSPEAVVEAALAENATLVGLSALMTTTLPSMKATIALLKQKKPDCRVVVGGAVLTEAYAASIGADCFAKTAMDTVRYAQQLFE